MPIIEFSLSTEIAQKEGVKKNFIVECDVPFIPSLGDRVDVGTLVEEQTPGISLSIEEYDRIFLKYKGLKVVDRLFTFINNDNSPATASIFITLGV